LSGLKPALRNPSFKPPADVARVGNAGGAKFYWKRHDAGETYEFCFNAARVLRGMNSKLAASLARLNWSKHD